MQGERVDLQGRYFDVDDYLLRPVEPLPRRGRRIYVGGESEPARDACRRRGDVWFINGQPLEDVAGLIADVAARPRAVARRCALACRRS